MSPLTRALRLTRLCLRGEVDARFNQSHSVLHHHAEWVDKGLMDFHVVLGKFVPRVKNIHGLAYLPELEIFARTELERQLVALQRGFRLSCSPFILAPGTSLDRLALIQEAITKVFQDPVFPKEFKKLKSEITRIF